MVVRHCTCLRCKRGRTLRRLPANFKCADIICDFCGYLAQVKAATSNDVGRIPRQITGAAWSVQKERMESGIYFPLFVVLIESKRRFAIYYLSADLQQPKLFIPRKPLSKSARRAGWQGFYYRLSNAPKDGIVLLAKEGAA